LRKAFITMTFVLFQHYMDIALHRTLFLGLVAFTSVLSVHNELPGALRQVGLYNVAYQLEIKLKEGTNKLIQIKDLGVTVNIHARNQGYTLLPFTMFMYLFIFFNALL
jgi:hypothetical protein